MVAKSALSVEWTTSDKSFEAQACTNEEALELLSKAESDAVPHPIIVEFFDKISGLAFGIGVGHPMTVVTFQDSLDPPYFISVGEAEVTGVVEFFYGNELTEYLTRNLIPTTEAVEALEWFVLRRARPEQIRWERL